MGFRAVSVATARRIANGVAWLMLVYVLAMIAIHDSGGDAHAYWAARGYGRQVDEADAFLYSPVFLQVLWPFQQLPWTVFRVLFLALQGWALVWMTGPVIAVIVLLPGAWSPVFTDLWFGNLGVIAGALAIAGLRNPHWWLFMPFTKATPAVLLIWSVARGQWSPIRALVIVVALSMALGPALWAAWLETLRDSMDSKAASGTAAAVIWRTTLAAMIIAFASYRRWTWLIPPALVLAQPVIWYSSFAILFGWFRLLRDRSATYDLSLAAQRRSPDRVRPT